MTALTLVAIILTSFGLTVPADDPPQPPDDHNVVEIVARGLTFEAPDEIPAGWTTFRFTNASPMVHFALIARYPDGTGVEDHQEIVAPIFQEGMDLLNEGLVDSAMAAFGKLPAWFGDIAFVGGPGLVSAGRTAETTVYMEPGTYVIECYVKTNGVFHSYNPDPDTYGMVHGLTVTEDVTDATAPAPDLEITLSREQGLQVQGDVQAGEHTVAVTFVDQAPHENFVGHDVHLVRLDEATDLEALETWLDWSQPTGLETPAPAVFLGGLNEMPAGTTGYFTAVLEPGRYAWVAEVPNPGEKGMMKAFTVAVPEGMGK